MGSSNPFLLLSSDPTKDPNADLSRDTAELLLEEWNFTLTHKKNCQIIVQYRQPETWTSHFLNNTCSGTEGIIPI
jgi:hypothetical protein